MFKTNLQILKLTLCGVISMTNAAVFCETSRETVVKVNKCPENEAEWIDAARRKNCVSLAGSCQYPNRFVYHCVLNPFVNETVEVCAYARKVFLGRCTEYSIRGNLIQQSGESCSSFPIPCPAFYLSTDAYKYQDCYSLVLRPEVNPTAANRTMITTFTKKVTQKNFTEITSSEGDNTTSVNMVESSGGKDHYGDHEVAIAVSVVSVAILIIVFPLVLWLMKKRGCKTNAMSSLPKEPNSAETSNRRQQQEKQSKDGTTVGLLHPEVEETLFFTECQKVQKFSENQRQV